MKKKDIIIILTCLLAVSLSSYFFIRIFFYPIDDASGDYEAKSETRRIDADFDEGAFQVIRSFDNYGLPEMEGVGRVDIFQPN